MARLDNVAVWSVDGKSIMKHVSEAEAFDMRDEEYMPGERKYILRSERKYGKTFYSLQLRPHPKVFKSSNSQSPSSITFEEMQANGLSSKFESEPEESFEVSQARSKIKMWKHHSVRMATIPLKLRTACPA